MHKVNERVSEIQNLILTYNNALSLQMNFVIGTILFLSISPIIKHKLEYYMKIHWIYVEKRHISEINPL